jgi:hypothetical protein
MKTKTTQSNATSGMLFGILKYLFMLYFMFSTLSFTFSQCKCLTSGGVCQDGNCGVPRRTACIAGGGTWFGNVPNCPSPLPVELREFKFENNEFVWITGTEINNDYFIIEKSYDYENWVEILTKPSEYNNSTTSTTYSATLPSFESNLVYFRLSQVDFDGTKTSFEPIAVDFSKMNDLLLCYPNPSSNGVFNLQNHSKVLNYEVFSFDGKLLLNEKVQNSQLDISSYNDGIYTVRIYLKDGTSQVQKIVKKG